MLTSLSDTVVDPSYRLTVVVHPHSIQVGLQFSLNPFVAEFMWVHHIVQAYLTPNRHIVLTWFPTRYREARMAPTVSLLMQLYHLLHHGSFMYLQPHIVGSFATPLPNIPMNQNQKFTYIKYAQSTSNLGFNNVWSARISMSLKITSSPALRVNNIRLCQGGHFDHQRYSNPERAHQLSYGDPM